MAGTLTYIRGPLGCSVLMDGKPWGRINDRRPRGWQVNVPTLNPANAVRGGRLFEGATVFPTLEAAKRAVAKSLED